MTIRSFRRVALAGMVATLVAGGRPSRADEAGPSAAPAERHRIAPRGFAGRRPGAEAQAAGGWWIGPAGIALALAVCGGICAAMRRYWPQVAAGGAGALRVVGRASLSPRHSVYLVKAGDRVLVVGTGPQGPPSLLGELDDPDGFEPAAPGGPSAGFDRRVGDDA